MYNRETRAAIRQMLAQAKFDQHKIMNLGGSIYNVIKRDAVTAVLHHGDTHLFYRVSCEMDHDTGKYVSVITIIIPNY